VRVLYQRQISPRGGHAATSSPSLAAVHVMLDAFRSLVIDSSAETGCSRHVIVGLPRREQHHERLQDRIPNPARPSGVLGRRNSDDGRRSCRQHGNLFRLRPARAASGHDSGSVIARRDLVQQSSAQRPDAVELGTALRGASGRGARVLVGRSVGIRQLPSRRYKGRHPTNIDANNISEPRFFVATLVSGVAPTMYMLLGAAGCLLLIACANVASLLLSRLLKRRKEIAVRLSLGATRVRIIRQLMTDSLLFSAAGGVLGTLLATWSLALLQSVLASQLPPNTSLALNWRALLFTGGATALCAMLIGLLPAVQTSRTDVVETSFFATMDANVAQSLGTQRLVAVRRRRRARLSRSFLAGVAHQSAGRLQGRVTPPEDGLRATPL
jgi:hypothetical protein